jgi:tetratricopeptide (TPR) repeat protein
MKYEQFHEDAHEKANYFSAWKLVHLLSTTSPDRLRRFRAYLVALGHTRTSEEAWALAFGDLPATELARDYQLYHQRDDLRGWAKPFQWPAPVVPRVRPLRAGEAHVLWAVLLVRHGERAAAEQQLQLLAAVDPDWPELRYWRALLLRPPDSLKLLREYVARVPKDGRGWRALVTREIDDGLPASYIGLDGAVPPALVAIEGDVRNLIQHASDPLSLNLIGWYFALRQNPVTGLNFAIRALQARPRCGPCWDTAGLLYFQAGKVHEALKAQERAASLYAERAPPDVLARLRRFRAAAAAASAATR